MVRKMSDTCSLGVILLTNVEGKEDRQVAGRVIVVIWMLWNNRNNFIWNNERDGYVHLGTQAFHTWQDWFGAQEDYISNSISNQHQTDWNPSSNGWLKCNMDVGFNRQRKTTNRGWCVRDCHNNFVFVGITWDYGLYSTVEAEAMAFNVKIMWNFISISM
ncbi:uncharacterized protein LOC131626389 [Vicia villosa]|uniref:uncharacterized protein LOC131626389 n=1 Tax=Vicia villosa TaxID=3911 RepID=UPI00273AA263|nr:uncharacterized protein LOC131626389 [Vicia villosa]